MSPQPLVFTPMHRRGSPQTVPNVVIFSNRTRENPFSKLVTDPPPPPPPPWFDSLKRRKTRIGVVCRPVPCLAPGERMIGRGRRSQRASMAGGAEGEGGNAPRVQFGLATGLVRLLKWRLHVYRISVLNAPKVCRSLFRLM
jgi:hypothetical protein